MPVYMIAIAAAALFSFMVNATFFGTTIYVAKSVSYVIGGLIAMLAAIGVLKVFTVVRTPKEV